MKKLHELLKKKPINGDIGIEIECEGKGFREINNDVWHSEVDGSLRGVYPNTAVEYVLTNPIPLTKVRESIMALNKRIEDAKPDFSYRTSVHVHVNVLDLTEDQLISYIYTYLLLEDALFHYCGNTRKGNRFCLRLQDADELSTTILHMINKGVESLSDIPEDTIRYSAINLASIPKYGSVEFRGMKGTLDVDTIDIWTNALISIRNFACHQNSCLDIHDLYVEMGGEKFLEYVLGSLSKHFTYAKFLKDIQKNYSLSLDIPYFYKHKKDKPPAKKKVVENKAEEQLLKALQLADIMNLNGNAVKVVIGNQKPNNHYIAQPIKIFDDPL